MWDIIPENKMVQFYKVIVPLNISLFPCRINKKVLYLAELSDYLREQVNEIGEYSCRYGQNTFLH